MKNRWTIRAAAMRLREQKSGVIVNTASESGLGHLGQSSYSAAKEGIVGLTRTIARDLGEFDVRCNAIRPRAATRLFDEEALKAMERTRAMLGDRGVPVPMPNPLDNKPEQVAALAVWLCTDAAVNVNGRTFVVGGELVGLVSGAGTDSHDDSREADGTSMRSIASRKRNSLRGSVTSSFRVEVRIRSLRDLKRFE